MPVETRSKGVPVTVETTWPRYLGGLAAYLILLPPWVLMPIPPAFASACLLTSEGAAVLLAQLCCMHFAYQMTPSFPAAGTALTAVAWAVTAAAAANSGVHTATTLGSAIWATMTTLNWGITLPYSRSFCWLMHTLDMRGYMPQCELRGAERLGASRTLFMFHPHGIVTVGFSCNGCWSSDFHARVSGSSVPSAAWNGTIFLIAKGLREMSVLFKLICDLSGRLESATRDVILRRMREGRNLAIVPGGLEDATMFVHGVHQTAMKRRLGLVKYALQHGYALQPIYTFGEPHTYYTYCGMQRLRLWLNQLQVPTVLFFGNPLLPLLPRRVRCFSFVGPPLQLPKLEEPSAEDVARWHAKYIDALQQLFDASKAEAGEPKATLEIW